MELGDLDKLFDPHIVCKGCSCLSSLRTNGKLTNGISNPLAWRGQDNHFNKKYASLLKCPYLPSSMRPQQYAAI